MHESFAKSDAFHDAVEIHAGPALAHGHGLEVIMILILKVIIENDNGHDN